MLCACSVKKNTAASRNWHAFTTRYNVFFNGKKHYDEQLQSMEKAYEDDYSQLLPVHPAATRGRKDIPQPSGDFKRTIEKMQKSIQLHSIKKKPLIKSASKKEKEFRAREEFNPFLHNAWITMAKSQYMNGDFAGAASTFLYITKHFTWLPEVVTEAKLWLALSYCAADWVYEAENVLHPIKSKELTNSYLTSLYDLARGDINIRKQDFNEAIPFLKKAASASSDSQRHRLFYLLGQLYLNLGKRREAFDAFKQAENCGGISYRAKFNARIKQSEAYAGQNPRAEIKALQKLTRYERNSEYLDQIYYAMGNIALGIKDTVQATKFYTLAIDKSERSGIEKALAQLALGDLLFIKGDYVKAQPCYSEAITKIPTIHPDYQRVKQRSEVLDELAIFAGNIHLQDSLLTLARLPEAEQRAAAQKMLNLLLEKEKREKEELEREQAEQRREANNNNALNSRRTPQRSPSQTGFTPNADKSWYFYNQMTKAQGKSEFQRRWGSRKLEDDWRRRNKNSFSFADNTPTDTEANLNSEAAPNDSTRSAASATDTLKNNPHNIEYYLSQIPRTKEEINNSEDIVRESLFNLAVILKDKLEDYSASRNNFNTLNNRWPDNIYRLDAYYNLYLMALREGKTAEAESWRNRILTDFADSPYGIAMQDPNYFDNLRRMNQIQESLYQNAYNAYLDNRNDSVHQSLRQMEKDYPLSSLLPKFYFIDALSYLTEKNDEMFKKQLTTLLERWPDTESSPIAGNIMKGIRSGRKLMGGDTNTRGLLWELTLSNDSIASDASAPVTFESNPNSPQLFVIAFRNDSVSANKLLYDLARFNFSTFEVKDFDLEPMNFKNLGLILVRGFENITEVEEYRTLLGRSDFKLPKGAEIILISKPNFELLLREGRSLDEYIRATQTPDSN